MTDMPVLKTPGELLLEARQAAGLGLDLVSESTKIPLGILQSLENDEYHKISGPLYVNSFLRTYAVDLGLDPVVVLEAYAKFSGEVIVTGPTPDPEAVWVDEEVKISRVGPPWGMIGMVAGALVVLVLLVFWLTSLRGCSADEVDSDIGKESTPVRESLLAEPPPSSSTLSSQVVSNESVTDSGDAVDEPETSDDSPTGSANGTTPVESPGHEDQPAIVTRPVDVPNPKLPAAVPGNAGILFQYGRRWPVVLRLLCDEPVAAQVVRDGERSFMQVSWSDTDESYALLPSEGIQQGRPYRTSQGLVVYWGARDQFSLKLGRTRGVEVTLNGEIRDIDDLLSGQEIILFLKQNRRTGGS